MPGHDTDGLRIPRLAVWGLVLALGASVVACTGSQQIPAKKAKTPETTMKVKLGVSREILSGLVWIADNRGLFESEGLDVSLVGYDTGKEAVDGFIAGEVDMATGADTPVMFASMAGKPFRIVASIGSSDDEIGIVGRRDRGIATPRDLKGKRVGTLEKTGSQFFLHSYLISQGLKDDEITFVSKDFKATTAALIAGDIDAMAIREPYISEALGALGENAVIFREPGLYRKTVTLFAGPDTDTELVRRVLAALVSAEDWATGHPREAEAIVALRLDRSPAEVRDALARSRLTVMLDQALLVDLESQARWAVKYGFAKSAKIPDYLEYVRTQDLNVVRPEAMTIIE